VLAVDDHLNRDFKIFKEVVGDSEEQQRRNVVPYFL
jgi:hypothetical protein